MGAAGLKSALFCDIGNRKLNNSCCNKGKLGIRLQIPYSWFHRGVGRCAYRPVFFIEGRCKIPPANLGLFSHEAEKFLKRAAAKKSLAGRIPGQRDFTGPRR